MVTYSGSGHDNCASGSWATYTRLQSADIQRLDHVLQGSGKNCNNGYHLVCSNPYVTIATACTPLTSLSSLSSLSSSSPSPPAPPLSPPLPCPSEAMTWVPNIPGFAWANHGTNRLGKLMGPPDVYTADAASIDCTMVRSWNPMQVNYNHANKLWYEDEPTLRTRWESNNNPHEPTEVRVRFERAIPSKTLRIVYSAPDK